ncbi:MAG TPA: hypothetical protein VF109_06185 [Mycobacteriales bacterium]
MRVRRLTALVVVAAAVGAGAAGCTQTIAGTGTLAEGASVGTPSPSGSVTSEPTPSETATSSPTPTPTPAPTPTTDPVTVKRRALCVLERAAITSINSNFNKAKTRDAQVTVLRRGSVTITGHLRKSGLPGTDRIYAFGKAVLAQLNNLVRIADAGGSPSTAPYNTATTNFQKACSSV